MATDSYEDKINRLIEGVADADVKSILKVCAKNRMYPKDCLTNGSMEQLVNKILALEAGKKP